MQLDWKKLGVIGLFIVAVLMFAFFLYWFFWRPIFGPTAPTETTTSTPGVLPGAATGGIRTTTTGAGGLPDAAGQPTIPLPGVSGAQPVATAAAANILVNDPTRFSAVTKDGKIVFYNLADSKFYRVDSSGNRVLLSDQVFFNVSNAVFDHAGQKAVIQYPDGSNTIYDFAAKKQIILPKHWQDFTFAPSDQEIVFKNIGLDPENRFLVTAKYDGTNLRIIEPIGENADLVAPNWSPNNQVIATYNTSVTSNQSEIFFLGQNNENFKSLIVEGRDFRGSWTPDSNRMLYSVYDANNGYKPQLWISDANGNNIGNNRQKINLNTWADRCTFAGNDFAFCSAPESLPFGAGIEPEVMTGINDQLWAINLQTGQTAMIAQPSNVSTIGNVMFSSDSPSSLFVTGKFDSKIYKINLSQ